MINIKSLRKSFGTFEVLKGIDLGIQAGQIVFVLGTSGTGKSVLLKSMVGLLKPDSGQIFIDGNDVANFSEDEFFSVRKICGMVFQQPALFDSLSVFENVAYGLRKNYSLTEEVIKKKVLQALEAVHLIGISDQFPAEISFGMQKRVSLARTIAMQPKILLFDEPTTGLDPVTTTAINDLIQELSHKMNTTSVVVSHDMKCALAIADQIVVLDNGKVVEQGTPEHILKSQIPLVRDFLEEVRL